MVIIRRLSLQTLLRLFAFNFVRVTCKVVLQVSSPIVFKIYFTKCNLNTVSVMLNTNRKIKDWKISIKVCLTESMSILNFAKKCFRTVYYC